MERWMERSRKRGREGEEGRKEEREGERTSSVKWVVLRIGKSQNPRIRQSQNPAIPESNNLGSNNPESGNPINLSDSVFLKDLHDRFSDRFGPEGVAVVGRMDAVD